MEVVVRNGGLIKMWKTTTTDYNRCFLETPVDGVGAELWNRPT